MVLTKARLLKHHFPVHGQQGPVLHLGRARKHYVCLHPAQALWWGPCLVLRVVAGELG